MISRACSARQQSHISRWQLASKWLVTAAVMVAKIATGELRLQAFDTDGNEAEDTISVVVKGGMKIGHFTLTFNDITLPVVGMPISVLRTYDTREALSGHGLFPRLPYVLQGAFLGGFVVLPLGWIASVVRASMPRFRQGSSRSKWSQAVALTTCHE